MKRVIRVIGAEVISRPRLLLVLTIFYIAHLTLTTLPVLLLTLLITLDKIALGKCVSV